MYDAALRARKKMRCEVCGKKGHSTKWHQAIAKANTLTKTGKKLSETTRQRMSETQLIVQNRPEMLAIRSKQSVKMWANRTEEERAAVSEKQSAALKGKPYSPEHLANLRISRAKPRSAAYRKKLGAAHKGVPSWNKGIKGSVPGFSSDPVIEAERRRKIGLGNLGKPRSNANYNAWYKGPSGKILMRSSYEVAFAHWCDKKDIIWEFEPRWFYVGKGDWNGLTYTPDFYLPAQGSFVEIKGFMRDENVRKLAKFAELYPQIMKRWILLKQEGLQALGVLPGKKAA